MTLNGVMTVTLRYFTEFCKPAETNTFEGISRYMQYILTKLAKIIRNTMPREIPLDFQHKCSCNICVSERDDVVFVYIEFAILIRVALKTLSYNDALHNSVRKARGGTLP